ncbi:MAG: helix-turn-helix domain-containing protein [Planctomycetes bacterium]|nr:helix-turn-helix domain-containing protein [Planctomycetota bacterium]
MASLSSTTTEGTTMDRQGRLQARPIEPPPVEPLALRIGDAARALGISERKLHDLTKRHAVPHVRLDGVILYPLPALRSWLASSATSAVIASVTADAAEGGDA